MKRRICLFLIVLLSVLSMPVFAKTDNGFYADDNVNLKKNLNTSTFVAGNNIEVSSEVDGMMFVAGNTISVSSKQDYLFVAGNNIKLGEVTAKDVFVAGNSINIAPSNIRDLYVAGSTVLIDSNIERNAYIGGSKVTINSVIDGNVKIEAEDIYIGEEAMINGTLEYPEKANVNISEGAFVSEIKPYETIEIDNEKTLQAKFTEACISYLSLLLIALLLLTVHKKLFKAIKKLPQEAGTLFKNMGIGFCVLVIVPVAAVLAMITVVAIPLSVICLMLYGILIYLSMIPTAYYVGNWVADKKKWNEYLVLTVSLLAIYVLKYLPVIGGLVGFVSLILGLGIFATMIKQFYDENKK